MAGGEDEWKVYLAQVVEMMTPMISRSSSGRISMMVERQPFEDEDVSSSEESAPEDEVEACECG